MSKFRFCGVVAAAIWAAVALAGCSSSSTEITPYSVRKDPTPEMLGIGYTSEQRENAISRTVNTNLRQVIDDFDRFFLLDQPLHFSVYPIP